jgi:hypothetical protein
MEIILIIIVIGIFIAASFLKNKLSLKKRLIISSVAGSFLVIWFWSMEDGEMFWKILITIVVFGGLIEQITTLKRKSALV